MNNKKIFIIIVIIAIIAIIAGSYYSGAISTEQSSESGTVTVLAGAGFSKVGNDLVTEFNKKYPNIKVNMKYGGGGEVLSTLETQKSGDIVW